MESQIIAEYGTWFLVLAFVFGLYMTWGIGANDVGNAMGTSVGSGAITVKQAVIIAGIFEFAGAFLAGGTCGVGMPPWSRRSMLWRPMASTAAPTMGSTASSATWRSLWSAATCIASGPSCWRRRPNGYAKRRGDAPPEPLTRAC